MPNKKEPKKPPSSAGPSNTPENSPQVPIAASTNMKLEQLNAKAQSLGIRGYVLLCQEAEGVTIFHVQNVKFKEGLDMLITGFHQLLALQIKNNPQYSEQYKNILFEMSEDMRDLIARANSRFKGLK